MAFIKLVGLLLSLVLIFHALRDSSAHVDLGRKLKGDMLMAAKEIYTPKMGTSALESPAGVVEKEDEARKVVNKEENNKVESSSNKKSSDKYASKESLGGHQYHVNNQDQLSKEEREVMNLMRRDYRNKPRRKPPINNHKPNN